MKRIYKHIEELSEQEIREILDRSELEELIYLPLSIGIYHHNWKSAQDLCLQLAHHENANVRANSIFGLAHIARTKGRLDKRLVKPIILKELTSNIVFAHRILTAARSARGFSRS
ncbi:hypothetical protein E0485_05750 [Paenibacillus albiflavus]|uniref:HEAT repeat domain-containing protein n=1 Tax=Paenibacillus albiflavus TaxID=2545760 RepID=A0A4R4EGY5_9BACL|nr:hypothetical protein [Paenibacillus albiflavus]TCZ79364.1 hypothetical protein E0485_05750 [Paenibacillus albiflavus]